MKHRKAFSLIELSVVILIIGILIAGVTQSTRLIGEFRLSSARSLSKSSPVNSIKGLLFWLDSTAEGAFDTSVENGSEVANFYDQNVQDSSKINFVQTTDDKYPIYTTNSMNNLPALVFDGTDDFMETSTTYDNVTASPNNENTFFIVAELIGSPESAAKSYFNFTSGSNRLLFNSGGSGLGKFTYITDTTYTIDTASSIVDQKVVLTFEKKNGVQTVYVNGTSDVTTANTASFTSFSSKFYLATFDGTATNCANMKLGEVIFFDRALKNDDREDIEDYLGKKWSIIVN